jgi:hypothetical protein
MPHVNYGKMRITKNKKAQMKIQQMVFMLLAVTLFFVLVGLFFILVVFSGAKESAELLEEREALLLVSKLANSPEFSCGDAFGGVKINCIDSDKAMALKSNINRYSNFWGVDGIKIKKIYPEGEDACTFENYSDCGEINLLTSSGTGVSNFVALCRKENIEEQIHDKCELARIIVYYGD